MLNSEKVEELLKKPWFPAVISIITATITAVAVNLLMWFAL